MSVANKGALDLRGHVECKKQKKAVAGEMSLAKVTSFFTASGSIPDNTVHVLAAEGAYSFHTVKHHSGYERVDCTSVLYKTVFPDSEIAHKF
jgi:hypothetical protein